MTDELDIDLDQLEQDINIKNKVEKRIKDLSEKVKTTSEERDSLLKAKQQLEIERDSVSKERDFYSKFSDSTAKYAGANDYKDKILEKVKAGYDVEDATVAVLAREGKLSPAAQVVEKDTVAGGSATTAMKGDGNKSLSEMTKDEKRQALMEGDSKGELERVLRYG